MDRKEIESKDQELLKDIRQIVRRNEEKSSTNKPPFQSMKFWLPAVIVVAVVAGLMFFNKPSPSKKADDSLQASADSVDQKRAEPDEKSMDLKITYETEDSEAEKAAVSEAQESPGEPEMASSETAPSPPKEPETSEDAVDAEVSPTKEMPPAEKEIPATVDTATTFQPEGAEVSEAKTSAKSGSEPAATSGGGPSIRIAKLVSCAGVENRQFVSPQDVFSMKKVSKPVVWMTVLTDKPPFTLTHVYYHNEKKYAEVPLEVKYPRMRTWSRLTLRYPYQTGKYRVEVVTDAGEVLREIEYTVVP